MKITAKNWDEIFPKASMKFQTFVNGAYCPQKYTKEPGGFKQIRYTTPEDVIEVLAKRLPGQKNPLGTKAVREREIWKYMTERAEYFIEQEKIAKEQDAIQNSLYGIIGDYS